MEFYIKQNDAITTTSTGTENSSVTYLSKDEVENKVWDLDKCL